MFLVSKISAFSNGSAREQLENIKYLKKMLEDPKSQKSLLAAIPLFTKKMEQISEEKVFLEALSLMRAIFAKTSPGLKTDILKEEFVAMLDKKMGQAELNKELQKQIEKLIKDLPKLWTIGFGW